MGIRLIGIPLVYLAVTLDHLKSDLLVFTFVVCFPIFISTFNEGIYKDGKTNNKSPSCDIINSTPRNKKMQSATNKANPKACEWELDEI